jgi:hypothetical protein
MKIERMYIFNLKNIIISLLDGQKLEKIEISNIANNTISLTLNRNKALKHKNNKDNI